jgi:hypothetical protein
MKKIQTKIVTPQVPTKVSFSVGLTLMVCMLAIASLNIAAALIGLERDSNIIVQDLKLVKR